MSKFVEQLILAFNKEYEIYQDYLKLAKKKKEVIIEGHVKELEKITKQEQDMILSMGKIQEIRSVIIGNILLEKKLDWIENITALTDYLEEEEKEAILRVRDQLTITLEEIKNINDVNSKLIQQVLAYIDLNVNLLTGMEMKGSTYSSKANEQGAQYEANLFDVKI